MESFFVYLQKSPYNMMLFGGALASGALLLWPLLMRPFRAGSEVTAFAAVQLINRKDAVVIDVRDIGEFEAGHIAGAKHVPQEQLAERIKELDSAGNFSATPRVKWPEPERKKTHWDFLLEEAVWLATDFRQERKWKVALAKKTAMMVMKWVKPFRTIPRWVELL